MTMRSLCWPLVLKFHLFQTVFQQNLLRPAHGCGLPDLRKGGHCFSQHLQTAVQISSIWRSASKCMRRLCHWGRAVHEGEHQPHQCYCSNTGAERFELGLVVNRSWGGPVIDPYPGYRSSGAVFMLSCLLNTDMRPSIVHLRKRQWSSFSWRWSYSNVCPRRTSCIHHRSCIRLVWYFSASNHDVNSFKCLKFAKVHLSFVWWWWNM